ncbi:threonine aldolase family protein [Hoeflea olei]|uniref:Aromatic amino acid beta-eliminating lyase/threonine aldolase domain-containing protein n=1 Tax=Hoeflea olei TaxID=1480615 RepID=A0A1C1YYU5_9HYPH|nr:beta-eliminating lyase-related protein [Hoeflea olei]OCW58589.1 hypothetical protein AWJ14_05440 [Hoeflea olei]
MQKLSFDDDPSPAETLRALAAFAGSSPADKYMSGELFDRLHGRLRDLLGKPAALFVPSGKMAQMMALKTHAERAGCSRIALHPRSHMEEYEARAYHELWGLGAVQLGGYDRLPTAADLDAIREPLGAIVVELPLRRLGCLLPEWEDLRALAGLARERGIAVHLDGARIWESQPFYGRPLAEIAALFDSVYVAFDKGLGGLSGGALLGEASVLDQATIWQRRAGGRALRSFPTLLSALKGLEERLPLMPDFHGKAAELANRFAGLPGVSVSPNPPHANAFYVSVNGDRSKASGARDAAAAETGLWLFDELIDSVDQSVTRFEVTIRGAGLAVSSDLAEAALRRFLAGLR